MDPETNHHQANHQFRRLPKGERRVRFADTMGMELASIFLFDLINTYYFASIHNHKHQYLKPQLQPLRPTSQRTSHDSQEQIKPCTKSAYHEKEAASLEEEEEDQEQHSNNNNNNNNHYSPYSYYQKAMPQKSIIVQSTQAKPSLTTNQQTITERTTTIVNSNSNISISKSEQNFEYHNLENNNNNNNNQNEQLQANQLQQHHTSNSLAYVCEFTQPISLISFRERVKLNKVHLETCSLQQKAGSLSISCTIRVLNQSFNKTVLVRYTTDEWHTFEDCAASYKHGSCDGWSDRFSSTFSVSAASLASSGASAFAPSHSAAGRAQERIIFAIKYTYDGDKESWDNNGGLNYVVKKY